MSAGPRFVIFVAPSSLSPLLLDVGWHICCAQGLEMLGEAGDGGTEVTDAWWQQAEVKRATPAPPGERKPCAWSPSIEALQPDQARVTSEGLETSTLGSCLRPSWLTLWYFLFSQR